MRFVTATIQHECNVFMPLKSDLEHIKRTQLIFDDEVMKFYRGTKTHVGGLIDASEKLGFDLLPTVYADASAWGIITKEAYDYILEEILKRIRNAGDFDGLLLYTHGAGYTEEYPDLEGHYFKELRKVVGPKKPIVSSFDWHANHTEEWQKYLDIPVGNDAYPHIDSYERGYEAAELIVKIVNGEIHPTKSFSKVPMIITAQGQYTGRYPLTTLFDMVHEFEKREDVLTITVAGGFPWCDVPTPWPTITVTTDDKPDLAKEIVDKLRDFMWSHRMDFLVRPVSPRDAVREAMEADEGPYVLGDIANNPGWGTSADGTVLLKALIDLKAKNAVIGAMWDRDVKAIDAAIKVGVGNELTVKVGGKLLASHGLPLEVTGKVRLVSDGRWIGKGPMGEGAMNENGKTVVLDIDGILLILTEERVQIVDLEFYHHLGIEPTDKQILCVNSSVHYRAAHDPIAKKIIEVDTPGIASPRLAGYPWKNLKRPIFPLDAETFSLVEWKTMEEQ